MLAEAVELASRYSTADSSRFVNGILARVAEHLRPLARRKNRCFRKDADLLGRDAESGTSKDRGIGNHHR